MFRRRFLQLLGLAPAALVVAPMALKAGRESAKQCVNRFRSSQGAKPVVDAIRHAKLGQYHTYYSVSDPEIAKAIKDFEERQCQDGSIKQSSESEDYSGFVTTYPTRL